MNLPFKLAKMNRIRIKDSDIDAFRDFFNCHYDGSPMPHVFNCEIMVEVTDRKDKIFFTVDYPDEYMSIKCYMVDQFVMEVLVHEVKVEKRKEGYPIEMTIIRNEELFSRVPIQVGDMYTKEMSLWCVDVVRYLIIFYHFNKDKVDVRYEDDNTRQKPSSNKKGGKKKKSGSASKRRTVYVPNIVKLKNAMAKEQNVADEEERTNVSADTTELEANTSGCENVADAKEKADVSEDTTESAEKTCDSRKVERASAKYTKPEWKRSGCTYVTKRGTSVTRKPTVCKRRKELAKEGVDFVLRPTKAEMT